jgi:hypothetical protein
MELVGFGSFRLMDEHAKSAKFEFSGDFRS